MKTIRLLAVLGCCTGLVSVHNAPLAGQARGGFGVGAQGRPADYLKGCKVAPEGRGGGGAGRGPAAPATFDAREYTVTGIPGVIAAGARWTEVWRGDGNN